MFAKGSVRKMENSLYILINPTVVILLLVMFLDSRPGASLRVLYLYATLRSGAAIAAVAALFVTV